MMPSDQLVASGQSSEDEQVTSARTEKRKRSDCLEREDYFMYLARLSAQQSEDPDKQVGACVVNDRKVVIGIGYNGMPAGSKEGDFTWDKHTESLFDSKHAYVCHAELNAIVNSSGLAKGCTLYSTLFPCNECAKLIIQSGIKEVVYFSDEKAMSPSYKASRRMLSTVNVKLRQFTPKRGKIEIIF